jgi:hypothetical protein
MTPTGGTILRYGFLVCVIVSVLLSGCLSSDPIENSPGNSPPTSPIPATNEPSQPVTAVEADSPAFPSIQMTVHNITVQTMTQKSGRGIRFAVFDLSLRNDGIKEGFSFTNTSLVCIEIESNDESLLSPDVENLQEISIDPLLPCILAYGQEKRGIVLFPLPEKVKSVVLYTRDTDWTMVGQVYIPDISLGSPAISGSEYPRNLELFVHSAVQTISIPSIKPQTGNKVAVINVSITNKNPYEVYISREHLLIQTERGRTLEHGGDRVEREVARHYLDFPLVIPPGETKSGSLLFIVRSGTRINQLTLSDSNFVINSMVNLNNYYRYE